MSRFKPTDKDFEENFNLGLFQENNIKLLVTVGGDDTASTANRIAKFLEAKQYPIHNIHVPKTIDNDLPLPMNTPTFGFNSAKDEGAHLARTVYEDARTSGNWLIISAMGRSAGHLALGIGEATHCPMTIIPEMFNKTEITLDKIVNLALSAILKRNILGIPYGTVVVAEGVFHDLDPQEIKNAGVSMTYDEHGHPELGKISKAVLFNDILEKKFKEIGLKVKTRPVEIGYDVRCQDPIAFDLTYCSELAMGAYERRHRPELLQPPLPLHHPGRLRGRQEICGQSRGLRLQEDPELVIPCSDVSNTLVFYLWRSSFWEAARIKP